MKCRQDRISYLQWQIEDRSRRHGPRVKLRSELKRLVAREVAAETRTRRRADARAAVPAGGLFPGLVP